ncbi:MAG: hypothetical protein KGH49_02120 [Candidatus Micrarchaeota archaeon]|nr:hypothetical protein [Candidatus Micrarchaeota archaeon]
MELDLGKTPGAKYIMLKSLETTVWADRLAKPFQETLRGLVEKGLAGQAEGYIPGIYTLTKKAVAPSDISGVDLLATIRDRQALRNRLEKEAEKVIKESELEIMVMWQKLFPNFAPKIEGFSFWDMDSGAMESP